MINETLEILVVEDIEENRKAAREFFQTQDNINVDFAVDYEEAIKKMDEKIYAAIILDNEMPKKLGDKPKKFGTDFAKRAEALKLPLVIITAFYHGEKETAANLFLDDFELQHQYNCRRFTKPKTNPRAWQDAYTLLNSIYSEQVMREIVDAKEYCKSIKT